jgi:hypothetical protein
MLAMVKICDSLDHELDGMHTSQLGPSIASTQPQSWEIQEGCLSNSSLEVIVEAARVRPIYTSWRFESVRVRTEQKP